MTPSEVAAALDITERTWRRWRVAGCPAPVRAEDLDAVRAWAREHRPEAVPEEDLTDRQRLLRAMAAEREAKAELAALRVKIQSGEFVPRSDAERWCLTLAAEVASRLEAMPSLLAPRLPGGDERAAMAVLEEWARRTREDLADHYERERDRSSKR
jgi:phage terminase Nu1 subunit (DNA packaging protein)